VNGIFDQNHGTSTIEMPPEGKIELSINRFPMKLMIHNVNHFNAALYSEDLEFLEKINEGSGSYFNIKAKCKLFIDSTEANIILSYIISSDFCDSQVVTTLGDEYTITTFTDTKDANYIIPSKCVEFWFVNPAFEYDVSCTDGFDVYNYDVLATSRTYQFHSSSLFLTVKRKSVDGFVTITPRAVSGVNKTKDIYIEHVGNNELVYTSDTMTRVIDYTGLMEYKLGGTINSIKLILGQSIAVVFHNADSYKAIYKDSSLKHIFNSSFPGVYVSKEHGIITIASVSNVNVVFSTVFLQEGCKNLQIVMSPTSDPIIVDSKRCMWFTGPSLESVLVRNVETNGTSTFSGRSVGIVIKSAQFSNLIFNPQVTAQGNYTRMTMPVFTLTNRTKILPTESSSFVDEIYSISGSGTGYIRTDSTYTNVLVNQNTRIAFHSKKSFKVVIDSYNYAPGIFIFDREKTIKIMKTDYSLKSVYVSYMENDPDFSCKQYTLIIGNKGVYTVTRNDLGNEAFETTKTCFWLASPTVANATISAEFRDEGEIRYKNIDEDFVEKKSGRSFNVLLNKYNNILLTYDSIESITSLNLKFEPCDRTEESLIKFERFQSSSKMVNITDAWIDANTQIDINIPYSTAYIIGTRYPGTDVMLLAYTSGSYSITQRVYNIYDSFITSELSSREYPGSRFLNTGKLSLYSTSTIHLSLHGYSWAKSGYNCTHTILASNYNGDLVFDINENEYNYPGERDLCVLSISPYQYKTVIKRVGTTNIYVETNDESMKIVSAKTTISSKFIFIGISSREKTDSVSISIDEGHSSSYPGFWRVIGYGGNIFEYNNLYREIEEKKSFSMTPGILITIIIGSLITFSVMFVLLVFCLATRCWGNPCCKCCFDGCDACCDSCDECCNQCCESCERCCDQCCESCDRCCDQCCESCVRCCLCCCLLADEECCEDCCGGQEKTELALKQFSKENVQYSELQKDIEVPVKENLKLQSCIDAEQPNIYSNNPYKGNVDTINCSLIDPTKDA
jgi:hypothetical protein